MLNLDFFRETRKEKTKVQKSWKEQIVPIRYEWIALGGIFIALIALSLIRIDATDTPVELATARLASQNGYWPTINTFSYTFPDYPLNQQYPIYQTMIFAIHNLWSWEGLSGLHCVLWIAVFLLWVLWGGSFKYAAVMNLAWVIALLGAQRRMILRPDILTLLLFILLLHSIDLYRRGRAWAAILFVLIQLLMVNSHQLFPLGLAVQASFLMHLYIVKFFGGRLGISSADGRLPTWPIVLALAGSILSCFGSPIGLQIIKVSIKTLGSLSHHREHVRELYPFYSEGYETLLVALTTAFALKGFWDTKRNYQPFHLFLWFIGAGLVAAAVRGLVFYALISIGIFTRSVYINVLESTIDKGENPGGIWKGRNWVRKIGALVTCIVCIWPIYSRWVSPARILGGTQPGFGLSLGVWPTKAINFLNQNGPPGKMLNMSWYTGNILIWDLYPRHSVFVDPRFETYPRSFLLKAIRAMDEDRLLDDLIMTYSPDWIIGEVRIRNVRLRIARLIREGSWKLVYADTLWVILVRNTPKNQTYIAAHELAPQAISPGDFLYGEPDLLALQQIEIASLYHDLGLKNKAVEMVKKAEPFAQLFPSVGKALDDFNKIYKMLN